MDLVLNTWDFQTQDFIYKFYGDYEDKIVWSVAISIQTTRQSNSISLFIYLSERISVVAFDCRQA